MYATQNTRFFKAAPAEVALTDADYGKGAKFVAGKAAVAGAQEAVGVLIAGGIMADDPTTVGYSECHCRAGGVVAAGDPITTDASGNWIAATTGNAVRGSALDPASAAGEIFRAEIFPAPAGNAP